MEIARKEIAAFLSDCGWTPLAQEYWVKESIVENNYIQDYTEYGLSMMHAFAFEKLHLPVFESSIDPGLSKQAHHIDYHEDIENFLNSILIIESLNT